MKILNYGSINIDYVYRVPHIARPGETLASKSYEIFTGGKGANQSVALAKAGAPVAHAGKVGKNSEWLLTKLDSYSISTDLIAVGGGRTGHAIIQVDDNGENSIVLYPGANRQIEKKEIDRVLQESQPGDILLLQNEINNIPYLIEAGHGRGMRICLNPAPFSEEVPQYPLHLVNTFIINRIEGSGITGVKNPENIVSKLSRKYPECEIILTVGKEGAIYHSSDEQVKVPAVAAEAIDTTGAGDTFIGYYLAARLDDRSAIESLQIACRAAAICVSRKGAQDSIPDRKEVFN